MASNRVCSIPDCDKPAKARGWCGAHWARWRANGDPLLLRRRRLICGHEGCEKTSVAKGYCKPHYHKFHRYGDTHGGIGIKRGERLQWINEVAMKHEGEDCLIWPYSRNDRGYPCFSTVGFSGYASRYVCILAHGEPKQSNFEAAHSCGNGHLGCVNWRHLRWATAIENRADTVGHGTLIYGEHHAGSKLTSQDVREIRSASGVRQVDLAKKYGVHQGTISLIIRGKAWARVD